jgi:hypothetical protein
MFRWDGHGLYSELPTHHPPVGLVSSADVEIENTPAHGHQRRAPPPGFDPRAPCRHDGWQSQRAECPSRRCLSHSPPPSARSPGWQSSPVVGKIKLSIEVAWACKDLTRDLPLLYHQNSEEQLLLTTTSISAHLTFTLRPLVFSPSLPAAQLHYPRSTHHCPQVSKEFVS